ncbi:MAG: hypothetical protein OXU23_23635 [Candidatus Poribacteria bacterium]|nr:hypothetical protein [Candidatus Poribacteria bacterium]
MYQFLKPNLPFMLCFFVVLMGCTNTKTSKEFSHTMEDGARVNIKIEYKPKSKISGDDKFGSYYYIVQYFAPKSSDHDETGKQQNKTKTEPSTRDFGNPFRSLEQQDKTKTALTDDEREKILLSLEKQDKTKTLDEKVIKEALKDLLEQREQPPTIWISFYDQNGYSLFTTPSGRFFPQIHANEKNQIDGSWEWKGHFDESYITVENFREIHSIKVK